MNSELLSRPSPAAGGVVPGAYGESSCRVSVAMVACNQERYVAEALDSVLAQRVAFPFEIVIADDASQDGTPRILEEYAARHGNIRLLLAAQKRGMAGNYVAALSACRGAFVAMLDGDDYWSSPDKLERQVAFLDRHPDCAICFHDATKVFDGTSRPPVPFCPPGQPPFAGLHELLAANFLPTSSVMYRRDEAGVPDWLLELRFVDWPLHILNARRGSIGYLPEAMSVYRIHPEGDWSSMDLEERARGIVQIYERVGPILGPEYRSQLRSLLAMRYFELGRYAYRRGDLGATRLRAGRALRFGGVNVRRERLGLLADAYAPFARRWWEKLRRRSARETRARRRRRIWIRMQRVGEKNDQT